MKTLNHIQSPISSSVIHHDGPEAAAAAASDAEAQAEGHEKVAAEGHKKLEELDAAIKHDGITDGKVTPINKFTGKLVDGGFRLMVPNADPTYKKGIMDAPITIPNGDPGGIVDSKKPTVQVEKP